MLIDDLKEKLKQSETDLDTIKSFWQNSNIEKEYQELLQESEKENFWQNPNRTEISKKLQKLRLIRDQYLEIIKTRSELNDLISIFENDEKELENIKQEVYKHAKDLSRFKISLLLNEEQDNSPCFLSINAGAGGTESQDWSEMLLRMYVRFCEREKLNASLVDHQVGEGAGIKSGTLYIKGKNAYGLLKGEQGIHRLVRISPFDANKRRHTSFSGVAITPEAPDIQINIDPKDLRIDTFRAGGAGGQHVNKTESAIRITHIPTNTVVQCQNERSQAQNKETAMKMLYAKLYQKQQEEQKAKLSSIEKKKIEWGSQIRSYILHPYKMVKDHRTDLESPQPELVLDGELMDFIEKYLIQSQTSK
ncbi:peptide chain release factor 2 [Candidatus Dependentiae bacterium]|nr:peptide chain release factor 2 [Candidatus Dependentiae bacterium]